MYKIILLSLALIVLFVMPVFSDADDDMVKQAGHFNETGPGVVQDMVQSFTPGSIAGMLLFGAVGTFAFLRGKKRKDWIELGIGILLLGYTYVIRDTAMIFIVGTALTALLFVKR